MWHVICTDRNILHNLTYNEYYDNVEGAMFVATAGEVNPWLCVSYSRLENNGQQFYGNFTTSRGAVHLDLQNMQDVYFKVSIVCGMEKPESLSFLVIFQAELQNILT